MGILQPVLWLCLRAGLSVFLLALISSLTVLLFALLPRLSILLLALFPRLPVLFLSLLSGLTVLLLSLFADLSVLLLTLCTALPVLLVPLFTLVSGAYEIHGCDAQSDHKRHAKGDAKHWELLEMDLPSRAIRNRYIVLIVTLGKVNAREILEQAAGLATLRASEANAEAEFIQEIAATLPVFRLWVSRLRYHARSP